MPSRTTRAVSRIADIQPSVLRSILSLDSPFSQLIGNPTYADAILDRIVHNAHRINLTGHSLRRSRANKAPKE
jgi:DNA replication protein DnaC